MTHRSADRMRSLRDSLAGQSAHNLTLPSWSGPFKDMAPGRWTWCFYCGVEMTAPVLLHGVMKMPDSTRTRDHVVPHSKGGRGRDNYLDCCARCNFDKSDLTVLEFMLIRRKSISLGPLRQSYMVRCAEQIRRNRTP